VLDLAAEKAVGSKPLPKGVGRGIAAHFAFGSYSAHVAEVSVTDPKVRVHRMVCAIDCGRYVNPGISPRKPKARNLLIDNGRQGAVATNKFSHFPGDAHQ
jgi:hypothetical protein